MQRHVKADGKARKFIHPEVRACRYFGLRTALTRSGAHLHRRLMNLRHDFRTKHTRIIPQTAFGNATKFEVSTFAGVQYVALPHTTQSSETARRNFTAPTCKTGPTITPSGA